MTAKCLLAIVLLIVAGCGDDHGMGFTRLAHATGLADPQRPAPVVVDIVCDASRGSSCTPDTLGTTLDEVLPFVAARPGSIARLWMQAARVEDATILHETRSTESKKPNRRARIAHASAWIAREKNGFMATALPRFASPARHSPIAETLMKVAWASSPPDIERRIIVIGDAREYSERFGDFECGRQLPKPKKFQERLHKAKVLIPGSLRAISVHFTYVAVTPVDKRRCSATIERSAAIHEIWVSALRAAGATDVRIESGTIQFNDSKEGDSHDQLD